MGLSEGSKDFDQWLQTEYWLNLTDYYSAWRHFSLSTDDSLSLDIPEISRLSAQRPGSL